MDKMNMRNVGLNQTTGYLIIISYMAVGPLIAGQVSHIPRPLGTHFLLPSLDHQRLFLTLRLWPPHPPTSNS